MSDNNEIDPNDLALFQTEMGQVTPLKQSNEVEHESPKPKPRPRSRSMATANHVSDDLSDDTATPVGREDRLYFVRSGIQHTLQRKLKRGRLEAADSIDLHGFKMIEARQALAGFLDHCRDKEIRTVIIVHGKGNGSSDRKPVLKTMVNHWLRQRPDVLAFCSAQPEDGGTGAVYVLLKRSATTDASKDD